MSLKILHTADWHLGKKLDHFSRHEEQVSVLNEICEIAEKENVDAVLIAGDLYDTFNPPVESVELFYQTLKRLSNNGKRAVVAIAGNHDSPDRIEAPDPLARECGIIFSGFPHSEIRKFKLMDGIEVTRTDKGFIELLCPGNNTRLRLILTPYANEFRLRTFLGVENQEENLRNILDEHWKGLAEKYCDDKGVNILVTHLFMMKEGGEAPEEPDDEKPILHIGGAQAVFTSNVPKEIQYVALGHLHRKQVIDTLPCPCVYSSSPLSYSFAEAGQKKYVMLLEANAGTPVSIREIPLQSGKLLLRAKFKDKGEAKNWLLENPEALVEITMVTETFLDAATRKELTSIHGGIIDIIPEIMKTEENLLTEKIDIDIRIDMDILFREYFKNEKGIEPSDAIMELFREIRSGNTEVNS